MFGGREKLSAEATADEPNQVLYYLKQEAVMSFVIFLLGVMVVFGFFRVVYYAFIIALPMNHPKRIAFIQKLRRSRRNKW